MLESNKCTFPYCPACSSGAYSAANDPLTVKNGLSLRIDAGISASYAGFGTAWCDLSGNGNHMSWSASTAPAFSTFNGYGVLSTTPIVGVAGAVSSVAYNNLRVLSSSYSVVAAYRPNSVSGNPVLLSAGNPSVWPNIPNGNIIHPVLINTAGRYAGGSYGALGTAANSANTGVVPRTSLYVVQATTFDGATERVYVNGNFDKSAAMTSSTPVSASNRVYLGALWNASQNMNANVGFVLFYNRSLAAVEVSQIYSSYASRFSLTQSKSFE
jgi:hypothetical protein